MNALIIAFAAVMPPQCVEPPADAAPPQCVDCPCGPECRCPDCPGGDDCPCAVAYKPAPLISNGRGLAALTADWCVVCRDIHPEVAGKSGVRFVDIDADPEEAKRLCGGSLPPSLPCFVQTQDGEPTGLRWLGRTNAAGVGEMLTATTLTTPVVHTSLVSTSAPASVGCPAGCPGGCPSVAAPAVGAYRLVRGPLPDGAVEHPPQPGDATQLDDFAPQPQAVPQAAPAEYRTVVRSDYHTHVCSRCGNTWSHHDSNRGNAAAHRCSRCGAYQYNVARGSAAVRVPVSGGYVASAPVVRYSRSAPRMYSGCPSGGCPSGGCPSGGCPSSRRSSGGGLFGLGWL